MAFLYITDAIDGHSDGFGEATGPFYLNAVDRSRASQTEMHAPRTLAGVSIAAVDLSNLNESTSVHAYSRANGITVRLCSNQLKFDPVSALGGDFVIKKQRLSGIGLPQVKSSVVVKVRHSDATPIQVIVHACLKRNVFEGSIAQIAEQFLLLIAAPGAISDVRPVI